MSFGKLGAMGRGFGHLGILGTAQLPALPSGYAFLIDQDGNYLVDQDGNYLIGLI